MDPTGTKTAKAVRGMPRLRPPAPDVAPAATRLSESGAVTRPVSWSQGASPGTKGPESEVGIELLTLVGGRDVRESRFTDLGGLLEWTDSDPKEKGGCSKRGGTKREGLSEEIQGSSKSWGETRVPGHQTPWEGKMQMHGPEPVCTWVGVARCGHGIQLWEIPFIHLEPLFPPTPSPCLSHPQ